MLLEGENLQGVGIVVDSGESDFAVDGRYRQAECPACTTGVNLKLADEFALGGEFDQLV